MSELDPLTRIAVQHGCFLRSEALAFGVDDRALARAVRRGSLVRVRRGCYVPASLWAAAGVAERMSMHVLAVMRVADGEVAASHTSSCSLQEIALYGVRKNRAHVTRLDGGPGRVDKDATHHEGLVLNSDLIDVRGVKAMVAGRAVLETASLHGVESGLVAADSALHQKLTTPDELHRYQQLMLRWPDARGLRLVAHMADGRSETPGESRSRYMMWAYGLPMPMLQHEVWYEGRLIGVCDFYWPEYGLLGEFDGKIKYGRLLKDGQEPGDVVFSEKQREDELRDVTGHGMVRWTWGELDTPIPTCARIDQALRRGARRRIGA